MFKVNNEDTKNFIVNFEHISHVCSNVSIANFEQVNAGFINNNNSTYSLVTLVINRKWIMYIFCWNVISLYYQCF